MNKSLKIILWVVGCLAALFTPIIIAFYVLLGSLDEPGERDSFSWTQYLPESASETNEWAWADGFLPDYSYLLRSKISEEDFLKFVNKLNLTPHTETREYTDDICNLNWSSDESNVFHWWSPTEKLDTTFVKQDDHNWSFAKYENGYLYFKSHRH